VEIIVKKKFIYFSPEYPVFLKGFLKRGVVFNFLIIHSLNNIKYKL